MWGQRATAGSMSNARGHKSPKPREGGSTCLILAHWPAQCPTWRRRSGLLVQSKMSHCLPFLLNVNITRGLKGGSTCSGPCPLCSHALPLGDQRSPTLPGTFPDLTQKVPCPRRPHRQAAAARFVTYPFSPAVSRLWPHGLLGSSSHTPS